MSDFPTEADHMVQWGYNNIRNMSHAFVVGPFPPAHAMCKRWIDDVRLDNCAAKCKICRKLVLAGGYEILRDGWTNGAKARQESIKNQQTGKRRMSMEHFARRSI